MNSQSLAKRSLRKIPALALVLSIFIPTIANAETLFEDTFDENPYENGWSGVGRYWNSSQDACGATLGYAFRDGGGAFLSPVFDTSGYTNLKLVFWHKNDDGGGYVVETLEGGVWSQRASVMTPNEWTRNEVEIGLNGAVTQFRVVYDSCACTRRIDCISIIGDSDCPTAPDILAHPSDLRSCQGAIATFMVEATGENLTYLWRKDEIELVEGGSISGATSATLEISGVDSSDQGLYRCVVGGGCASRTSDAASLIVASQPTITRQPEHQPICLGESAEFMVEVAAVGAVTYQWRTESAAVTDGGRFSGATTANLRIVDGTHADEGRYLCFITDDCGAVVSDWAELNVQSECDFRVSPSGHYVQYKGEPLLLVGDSGTQVVTQNTNIDYRAWIDDCAERGIRSVHVWSFMGPRQKQDGTVTENRYGYVYPGITPWRRNLAGPLATDQLPQWDLRDFDEGPEGDSAHYWPRLRDLCLYAKGKKMIVGYTVFTGWMKGNSGAWPYHPFNEVNGGHLTTYPDAGVTIGSPGSEVWMEDWEDTWPAPMKTQWIWERFAKKAIEDLGSIGNVFFVFLDEHSYTEGNMGDHFRDFFRSRGQVWVDWEPRRSSVDWVMSDTFGGEDKNWNALAGFNTAPARPYFFLEGEPYQGNGVRTAIWTFAIGGGAYFFHADAGQETPTTGIMGYDPNVPGGDKGMVKRDRLGHASRFFNEHIRDLDSLVPHNDLTSTDAYCLADPGREYVVYSKSDSDSFTLDLSAATGELRCRFYDPRTGEFQPSFDCEGGGVWIFTKPDTDDWALLVDKGSEESALGPSFLRFR